MREAKDAWLAKSLSRDTRSNYARDLEQFMAFAGMPDGGWEHLAAIRPKQVNDWRDHLIAKGLTNASIRRKLTVLRSLFSYLQSYGFLGANPAHSDFVDAPPVARDGKTVGLSPEHCRRLLDAPPISRFDDDTQSETPLPQDIRNRAIFGVLAFTGCRVGELVRLKVNSYKLNGVHRVLGIHGKGGKERLVPLAAEAAERLEAWLDSAGLRGDLAGPLFRRANAARDHGKRGFAAKAMTRRAVQKLVDGYVRRLNLDPNVTVHSFRVTALTMARENGSDIIDLQDCASCYSSARRMSERHHQARGLVPPVPRPAIDRPCHHSPIDTGEQSDGTIRLDRFSAILLQRVAMPLLRHYNVLSRLTDTSPCVFTAIQRHDHVRPTREWGRRASLRILSNARRLDCRNSFRICFLRLRLCSCCRYVQNGDLDGRPHQAGALPRSSS
jgi:integrase/recombinase XerD